MEVRKGYKQTEVGIIPEDWGVKSLGEVTDLEVGYAFKSSSFRKHEGIPLLRGENVGYGQLDWTDTRRLPNKQATSLGSYMLQPGDIVIGMDRTFTKSGTKISLVRDVDCPCLLVQRVGKFVPKKINSRFLWALLSSERLQRSLQVEQKGMDIPHLSRLEILSPLIPLPPTLAEQEAIAEALSDADALIESLETLLAKKRQVKQGAMSELLSGERHLLGFSGEEKKSLIRICEIEKGEQLNRDTLSESGDYPVWNGGMEPSGYTDKWNTEKDTITISEGGNSCGFVNFVAKKFWRGGHCYALKRLDLNVSQPYLYQYLKHREKDIMALRVGSGLPNIQRARLSSFDIYLPTLPEQTAIAEILSDMDAEIRAVEEKLSKARQVKAGMMSALLGEG